MVFLLYDFLFLKNYAVLYARCGRKQSITRISFRCSVIVQLFHIMFLLHKLPDEYVRLQSSVNQICKWCYYTMFPTLFTTFYRYYFVCNMEGKKLYPTHHRRCNLLHSDGHRLNFRGNQKQNLIVPIYCVYGAETTSLHFYSHSFHSNSFIDVPNRKEFN